MIRPTKISAPASDGIDLASKTVQEAMQSSVAFCSAELPLEEIWQTMAERRLRFVIVVDGAESSSTTWGVLSDLDLLAAASVRNLCGQVAAGSAARPAVTITPGETLRRASQLMVEHDVAELIVTDPLSNRPIGVLSTLDVVVALAPGH